MFDHIIADLLKSGWVILPLLLTSLIGWLIAFHRLFVLQTMSWRNKKQWRKSLAEGKWREYLENLSPRGLKGRPEGVVRDVYMARHQGRAIMESKLDEALKFNIPELEKWLSTLAILASAAPLMGLLGTVSGMVRTFQVISAFGTGNQALMSDSISESLTATQNGLLVAFPLMLIHVYLAAKAEGLEKETEAAAQGVINLCLIRASGPASKTFLERTAA